MGRLLLVCRLATRDMRHHVAQVVLLLVAIAAATTVLTLALALNGVTSHPYQRTRAVTKGPDVVAYLRTPSQATALIHANGVTASSGPYAITSAILHFDGRTAGALVEGRNEAPAAVDQPDVLAGSWVRPGGVVLERTFAEALGVNVGGRVILNGHPFEVIGIAVTAAQPPYPNLCYFTANACTNISFSGEGPSNIGLIWMTKPDAVRLTSAANPLGDYALNLKLRDAEGAPAFINSHNVTPSGGPGTPGAFRQKHGPSQVYGVAFATSSDIAAADGLLVQDEQSVLAPGALLLGLLALASVAVLVGGRLAEYTRRVGLLKAVGGTPGLVAATFLTENLLLALVAAAAGLVVGRLVAPLLTNPGAALVGSAGAPSLTVATTAEVVGVALAVAIAATLVPAIRAARTSTVSALADAARSPKRRGTVIRFSRRLPVPALFGLRLVARRPRRALLSAACIAVTTSGIVAVLAFHADVAAKLSSGFLTAGLVNPVVNRDEQMLTVITVTLVTLAALTVIFTAWATVLDARRASALMRAIGATPRQVRAGLETAQVLSALPGAILGVPLGIALFKAAAGGSDPVPPTWCLAAAVLGTLVVVAGLTTIPARIGTRHSVTEALQSEGT